VRRPGLAALLVAAAAVAGCTAESTGSERLSVRAPAWSLAGRGLTLEVTASGALAERRSSLVVAVDGRMVSRESVEGGRATIAIAAEALPVGRSVISVKTGSERSVVEVRVLPVAYAFGAAVAAAALLIAAVLLRRRRHDAVNR
jgi:hypothetical protein